MSKNVAVFVDVANVFYAAKAAGVDIDYVTLLKAATAGRDLVRAYAYTGLDPENENQRQFHAFLARNGYSVVSKDIRKYGDGKVKANLDIELVVDLMRTARNLDIAVVVSGDGDFAPAIRAVQQTGVRVEVISFRGNTSSDLIDVADVFTDITQIARVERSSRSGRRVAAEEDLSMTEVPEKETEGASRRRRSWRGEGRDEARHDERRGERREHRAVAVPAPVAGGVPLVVLPGEKLSKVAALAAVPAAEPAAEEETEAVAPGAEIEVAAGTGAEAQDASHHRRRRRGGRGRGRGRGQEGAVGTEPVMAGEEGEPEEVPEAEAPRVPQHSTFGSVWDSQLGMPTAPTSAVGSLEDEDLEEPEIPEYLLTERRQRGRTSRTSGNRTVRGGRGAAYQQAVERERYGRTPGSVPAAGPRPPRSQDRRARPQSDRAERARTPREAQAETRGSSAEPWSEVPPEVAELLRAELARRGGERVEQRAGRDTAGAGAAVETQAELAAGVQVSGPAEPAPLAAPQSSERPAGESRPRAGRPRTRGSATVGTSSPVLTTGVEASETSAAPIGEVGGSGAPTIAGAEPPRRRTRTTAARPAGGAEPQPTAGGEPATAPRPRTRRASPARPTASREVGAVSATAEQPASGAPELGSGEQALAAGATPTTARKGRRTTRAAALPAAGSSAEGEPVAPAPRRTRRTPAAPES